MRAAWWWLDRWRKSSAYRDLTPEQKGMYRDLLDEVWLREGGVIPDDDRVLGLIVGDPERWKVLRESILSRFRKVKGGWTNDTAQEVMAQAKRRRDNQKAYRDRLQSNNKSDNGSDNESDNDTDNTADNKPDSPSPSPNVRTTDLLPTYSSSAGRKSVQAPADPLEGERRDVVAPAADPLFLRAHDAEKAIRVSTDALRTKLYGLVSQMVEEDPEHGDPTELMRLVTAYDRPDGKRVPGVVNAATLSHERLENSIADAEALLAEWRGAHGAK